MSTQPRGTTVANEPASLPQAATQRRARATQPSTLQPKNTAAHRARLEVYQKNLRETLGKTVSTTRVARIAGEVAETATSILECAKVLA